MRLIKVGIANVNSTVGAFTSNTDKLIHLAKLAAENKITAVVYPEGVIGGYSPEDLLDWRGFTAGQWKELKRFARATCSYGFNFNTIHLVGLFLNHQGENYNAVACVCGGEIIGGLLKENLPTYNVFYEGRKCSRGRQNFTIEINGVTFGDVIFEAGFGLFSADICEDIWRADGPLRRHAYSGSEINFTSNASPFRFGVYETRKEMLATRSADNIICEAYSNLVGANDGLVFDGGGFVYTNGRSLCEVPRLIRDGGLWTCIVDLDDVSNGRAQNTTWRDARAEYLKTNIPTPIIDIDCGPTLDQSYETTKPKNKNFFLPAHGIDIKNNRYKFFEELEQVLVIGTADYISKVGKFKKLGNAGSGGKDSAVTIIIEWLVAKELLANDKLAVEKIKDGYVTVFSMPSRFNQENTQNLIRELAEELGVRFVVSPVSDEEYVEAIKKTKNMLGSGEEVDRITKQNIQARIRFTRMCNWANASGGFFPQNSNMSEKAVGYCTIGGGDIEGNLSIIANLPKTVVSEFLLYLRHKYSLKAAEKIYRTKASAELEDNQEDETDLMPFPVLDACFAIFAGQGAMPLDVYRQIRQMFSDEDLKAMRADYDSGMLKDWVKKFTRLFMSSIFKWVRSPLSLHLGSLDLERERALQIPVVQSMEWLLESLDAIDLEP